MYEGVHAVPLMTIHKSKGLEYHTVIFVGLDDGAWWSFSQDEIEATAGFLWLSPGPSSGSYLLTVPRVAHEQKLRPCTSCLLKPGSKLRPDRIDVSKRDFKVRVSWL
ncbi:3'-5' exonuclease [Pseudomonas sp. NA13]